MLARGAYEEHARNYSVLASPRAVDRSYTTPPSTVPPADSASASASARVSRTKERRSEVRYACLRRPWPSRGSGSGRTGAASRDGQIERTYSAACPVQFFRSSWTRAGRERMLGCHFPTLPMALAFRVKHGAVLACI